jgi:hypothetical protein
MKIFKARGRSATYTAIRRMKKENTMSAIRDGKEERISKLRARIQFILWDMDWEGGLLWIGTGWGERARTA